MAGARGRSGRRPTPTRLRVVRNNPGRRPLNDKEPKPQTALPNLPAHLSDEAKEEWKRVGKLLADLGLVSELDRGALAGYCQAWGRWVAAEEALKQYGVVVNSPTGYPMQSPFLAIANKALEQMRGFLIEFGMTPSSRTRVRAEPRQEPDPLEEFLNSED